MMIFSLIALWFLMFLVAIAAGEFRMISKGVPSFAITQWLWDNVAWIRKIRW